MTGPNPRDLNSWKSVNHQTRCRVIGAVRNRISAACDDLVELCKSEQRTDPRETVSSELMPLCSALKFIGRQGASILRDQHHGMLGRPVWLWGVRSRVQRVARGDVLVLAAWNYPLLLPGVQMAQALAAGNRVFLKPAPGCEKITQRLVELFYDAGVPHEAIEVLSSQTQAAINRIDQGVDLVVLTGSAATGRAVLRQCAEKLTPTILELSGCDAVIIGRDADLSQAAKSIRFGLMFNAGATCIGPRRIIVNRDVKAALIEHLRNEFNQMAAVRLHRSAEKSVRDAVSDARQRGASNILPEPASIENASLTVFHPAIFEDVSSDWAIANDDLFAPVSSIMTFATDQEAIEIVNKCRYRLAASVFGGRVWASGIANRLQVGTVTINDIIFPTADPRLPFCGRGESGFGVTRGVEGLLEMTVPRVVALHRGTIRLHLMNRKPGDFDTLASSLTLTHGRLPDKVTALRRMWRGIKCNINADNHLPDQHTDQEK